MALRPDELILAVALPPPRFAGNTHYLKARDKLRARPDSFSDHGRVAAGTVPAGLRHVPWAANAAPPGSGISPVRDGAAQVSDRAPPGSRSGGAPHPTPPHRAWAYDLLLRHNLFAEAALARIVFGTRADTVSPWLQPTPNGCVFHAGPVLGVFRATSNVHTEEEDRSITASVTLRAGERAVLAVVAGEDQPLGVPGIGGVDGRIKTSDGAWRAWAEGLRCDGPHRGAVCRSALALKLLLFSPTGAIAAAATTSLPGAEKEEGAFLACTFWLVEAYAVLGRQGEAEALMNQALGKLPAGVGVLSEMLDVRTGDLLGNLPQDLSHLALIHAAVSLDEGSHG